MDIHTVAPGCFITHLVNSSCNMGVRQPMDDNNMPTLPSPTLLVPLGSESIKNLLDTLPIYFKSDPRRTFITQVAAPLFSDSADSDSSAFDVLNFEQLQKVKLDEETSGENALNLLFLNNNILKNRLENTWHQLRSHDTFISAGLAGYRVPNINIIVLADLWDENSSVFLLPVLYHLKQFFDQSSKVMFQVLLKVARFPGEERSKDQEIRIYRLLTELENRIQPRKEMDDDPLLKYLGYPASLSLDHIRFYLLDSELENDLTVSNRNEYDSIISSFLLSALNGQIATVLTDSLTDDLLSSNRGYFASTGSTSIVFDPNPIMEYCSRRLGAEYLLRNYWPTTGVDKLIVEKYLKEAADKVGDPLRWIQRLLKNSKFSLVQNHMDWDIQFSMEDLSLQSPAPDMVKECTWTEDINAYYKNFEQVILPSLCNGIEKDSASLQLELVELQKSTNCELISQVELHPNVLINGKQMLQDWLLRLKAQQDAIEKVISTQVPLDSIRTKFDENIAAISEALNAFPSLPIIIKIIPRGKFKTFVLRIYSLLKLRARYRALDVALAAVKDQLALLTCIPVKARLAQEVKHFIEGLMAEVERSILEFDLLDKRLRGIQENLAKDYHQFIPGVTLVSGCPNFQLYPANQEFTENCYTKYQPLDENIRLVLLQEMGFLHDWKDKDDETLISILLDYGRKAFAPVNDIHLNRVLRETKAIGIDDQQIRNRIWDYSQSCICLLKPDWDNCEITGGAWYHFAHIDCEMNPILNPLITEKWRDWDIVYSNTPYYFSFTTAKTRIPLAALEALIKPGELAWKSLSSSEMRKLDILPGKSNMNPPVTIQEIGKDIVQKVFNWTFTPKGSTSPVYQTITLNISKDRYNEVRARKRYSEDYHLYSEEEMPEIRDLTLAFQKLHSEHNWSTYNQAFNILTFVQSCFPYSFDEDTTSINDWPRYPIETLYDGTGDCEDVAILCGAVLARLGFSSVLLGYPRHLAFGVQAADTLKGEYIHDPATGNKYYYGEATAKGWRLGEIPTGYRSTPPEEIFPITIAVKE